eukprot:6482689-Amphidinium_carterae.1
MHRLFRGTQEFNDASRAAACGGGDYSSSCSSWCGAGNRFDRLVYKATMGPSWFASCHWWLYHDRCKVYSTLLCVLSRVCCCLFELEFQPSSCFARICCMEPFITGVGNTLHLSTVLESDLKAKHGKIWPHLGPHPVITLVMELLLEES